MPDAPNKCPRCGAYFRTLDDESGQHPCPHCGLEPDDRREEEEPEEDHEALEKT